MLQGNFRKRAALLAYSMLACSIFFASATMQAQVSSGSIAGRVTDPAHAVVPAANVTLTNQGTGIQKSMKCDAGGDYMFPIVDPGSYKLRVDAPGFKAYEVLGLTVQVAQSV